MDLINFRHSHEKGDDNGARISISKELEETFHKNLFSLMDIDFLRCERKVLDDGMIQFTFTDLSDSSMLILEDMVKMLTECSFPRQHLN